MALSKLQWPFVLFVVSGCFAGVARSAEPLQPLRMLAMPGEADDTAAPTCGFSPDGKLLVASYLDKLALFEVESGKPRGLISLGTDFPVDTVGFLPDGKGVYAYYSTSGMLRIWDAKTGKPLRMLKNGYQWGKMGLSPGGEQYVVFHEGTAAGERSVEIAIHQSSDGKQLRQAKLNGINNAGLVKFNPHDGGTLALIQGLGSSILLLDATDLSELKTLDTFAGDFAFSPDAKRIARVGLDRRVVVWDVASGEPLPGFTDDDPINDDLAPMSVAYAPDGKVVAYGGYLLSDETPILGLIDVDNKGTELALYQDKTRKAQFNSLAFSPDGTKLASTSLGQTGIALWDVSKLVGKPLKEAAPPVVSEPPVEVTRPEPVKPEPPAAVPPLPVITVRTWTSVDGKFSLMATYVQQNATHVQLKRADGSLLAIPKSKLSPADLAYLTGLDK